MFALWQRITGVLQEQHAVDDWEHTELYYKYS